VRWGRQDDVVLAPVRMRLLLSTEKERERDRARTSERASERQGEERKREVQSSKARWSVGQVRERRERGRPDGIGELTPDAARIVDTRVGRVGAEHEQQRQRRACHAHLSDAAHDFHEHLSLLALALSLHTCTRTRIVS